MADPSLVICPECNARHHEDLIRCPGCHAFLIDANPWRSQQSLLAAMGALVITILVIVFSNYAGSAVAIVVANPISQLIVLLGVFGMLLLLSRLRTVSRQEQAFVKVRQITCDNRAVTTDMIDEARLAVAAAGIPAYNQALAFQRLRWLSSAASAPVSERQAVLEACRQHADADMDAVDQSFSRVNFLVWLLPTAGFLGTVFGMTEALQAFAGVVESGSDFSFNAGLTDTARNLGVAFHTTLVGLAAVIPLLALATLVRSRTQTLIDSVNRYYLQLGTHMLYAVHEPALDETPPPLPAAPRPAPQATTTDAVWPTPPSDGGEVPSVIAMMADGNPQRNRQAAYLVQAVGTLAKSGAVKPDQFQAVLNTPDGNLTVPAIVRNEQDTQVLVYTWAAAWDDGAISDFEAWLQRVDTIGAADQTAPVLLVSASPWPTGRPAPRVLQALHVPISDAEAHPETATPATAEPPPVPEAEPSEPAADLEPEAEQFADYDESPLEETVRTQAPGPLSPPSET